MSQPPRACLLVDQLTHEMPLEQAAQRTRGTGLLPVSKSPRGQSLQDRLGESGKRMDARCEAPLETPP